MPTTFAAPPLHQAAILASIAALHLGALFLPIPHPDIPRFADERTPVSGEFAESGDAEGAGPAIPAARYVGPAIVTRNNRLAGLIDACYPAGARRPARGRRGTRDGARRDRRWRASVGLERRAWLGFPASRRRGRLCNPSARVPAGAARWARGRRSGHAADRFSARLKPVMVEACQARTGGRYNGGGLRLQSKRPTAKVG